MKINAHVVKSVTINHGVPVYVQYKGSSGTLYFEKEKMETISSSKDNTLDIPWDLVISKLGMKKA